MWEEWFPESNTENYDFQKSSIIYYSQKTSYIFQGSTPDQHPIRLKKGRLLGRLQWAGWNDVGCILIRLLSFFCRSCVDNKCRMHPSIAYDVKYDIAQNFSPQKIARTLKELKRDLFRCKFSLESLIAHYSTRAMLIFVTLEFHKYRPTGKTGNALSKFDARLRIELLPSKDRQNLNSLCSFIRCI